MQYFIYILLIILSFLMSYGIGNISFAKIISKSQDVNICQVGSKNPGATNVTRQLGKKYGFFVFLLDCLKAYLAIWLTWIILFMFCFFMNKNFFSIMHLVYLAGIFCMLGHCFPFLAWIERIKTKQNLHHRGGKGVSCFTGMLMAINPYLGLIYFGLWILIVFCFKYVSLASIMAALFIGCFVFVPFLDMYYLLFLFNPRYQINFLPHRIIIFSYIFLGWLIILFCHKTNLIRLFHHQESKIKLFQKQDKSQKETTNE